MAFDPHQLTPSASLNRLRIVNLPGLELDADVRGRTGYELASSLYLVTQILKYADILKLTADEISGEGREIPKLLNRCLEADDDGVRATAADIAGRFGRNLAYLLLTLKRGDLVNREARTDWDGSEWEHWGRVNRVVLGGGLLTGAVGDIVVARINAEFEAVGQRAYAVALDPYGPLLPLVGAAAHAPAGTQGALVLDFGSSFVKRAYALYADDALVELAALPPLPSPRDTLGWMTDDGEALQGLIEAMLTAFLDSLHSVFTRDLVAVRVIPTSVAAFVQHGQVAERQGGKYRLLREVSDNAERFFSAAISARLGVPVEIRLLHDGSAAAAAYAGEADTAVLILGTSLGVGFAPPAGKLRRVQTPLAITSFKGRG